MKAGGAAPLTRQACIFLSTSMWAPGASSPSLLCTAGQSESAEAISREPGNMMALDHLHVTQCTSSGSPRVRIEPLGTPSHGAPSLPLLSWGEASCGRNHVPGLICDILQLCTWASGDEGGKTG